MSMNEGHFGSSDVGEHPMGTSECVVPAKTTHQQQGARLAGTSTVKAILSRYSGGAAGLSRRWPWKRNELSHSNPVPVADVLQMTGTLALGYNNGISVHPTKKMPEN